MAKIRVLVVEDSPVMRRAIMVTLAKDPALEIAGTWGRLPAFDLILLRNVLIYFGPVTKRRVLKKTREHLQPDSYLLLGAAETTLHVAVAYEVRHLERSSFYQIAAAKGTATRGK
ncbi:hypothetical protein LBMAG56_37940 [Verrucomicrobiota bacterium]|nr:hypothetical protein LBMAG56_37940 [Verrucomicrobiota bacterium]